MTRLIRPNGARPSRRPRKKLSRELALSLGQEVLAARPPQISWKTLEARYGMCRARLVQLRQQALSRAGDGT